MAENRPNRGGAFHPGLKCAVAVSEIVNERTMGLIYQIIRKDSGRVYVGMTIRDALHGRYGRYPSGWIRGAPNFELRSDANRLGEAPSRLGPKPSPPQTSQTVR